MALNQRTALADLYYLRAISTFGDKREHSAHYPLVQPLLWRASVLDEQFLAPYLLSGRAAALLGTDTDRAVELLARGRRAHPSQWLIAFYQGFLAYFWRHDDVMAAEALRTAALSDQAPPQLAALAAALSINAETPEAGLALLDTILQQDMDEGRRENLLVRRNKLLLEVRLRALEQARASYEQRFGQPLRTLEDLRRAGFAAPSFADPLGGSFFVRDGRIATTHEAERLRIADDARGYVRGALGDADSAQHPAQQGEERR